MLGNAPAAPSSSPIQSYACAFSISLAIGLSAQPANRATRRRARERTKERSGTTNTSLLACRPRRTNAIRTPCGATTRPLGKMLPQNKQTKPSGVCLVAHGTRQNQKRPAGRECALSAALLSELRNGLPPALLQRLLKQALKRQLP